MGTLIIIGILILLALTMRDFRRALLKKRCPHCQEMIKTHEINRECVESEQVEEDKMSNSIVFWSIQNNNHFSKLKWKVGFKCDKCGNEWDRTIVEVRAWKDRYKTIIHGAIWLLVVLAVFMGAFKISMIING